MRPISRRRVLAGTAALGASSLAPVALAQTQPPLRIAMSLSDVPRLWAGPDAGFEGLRFGGYMAFDALTLWDMSARDKASGLVPGLAESWRVDPADNKRWIFTLRQGVKFHDGSDFDADAMIWNLDSIFKTDAPQFHAPRVGMIRSRLASIASYEKIDARTIAIVTNEPNGMFIYETSFLMIASPARWREAGGDWQRFAERPSGTGPYRVVNVVPRERAELEANAAYWDRARVPKTQRTVLVPIADSNARVAALRSGQVDMIETVPPDAIPSLRQAGMRVDTNVYPHVWAWRLNVQPGSPFADLRVRKAANLAIDRDSMVQLLGGSAQAAQGKVVPSSPWFGKPSFQIKYDVAEARKLMTEAGYGPNRRCATKIVIASGGGGQMVPLPMNELLQENLRQIWMDVTYEIVDFGTIIAMMREGSRNPRQQGFHGINIAIPTIEPTVGWVIYDSALVNPRGVNWGYYNSPAVDTALRGIRTAFDTAAQNAAMAKLHEVLVDEAAALFVVHDLNPRAYSARVEGYVQAQNWFQDYTTARMR
ncbi:MAG: ABC transporter substrate-binding protein [Azospirillum sp.]|nr:ABC transporter substrate-binding protein [Azospirillum sp.]